MKSLALFLTAFAALSIHAADNELSKEEKAAGWKLLFNGKNLDGWRGYTLKGLPESGWKVEDGLLKTVAKAKGKELITEQKFDDFELAWEWRVEPGGNNGIKYFVTEARPQAPGPEYQMIDDEKHPDGQRGGTHQTAAFYDVLPPADDKPVKPGGEWNSSKLVVKGKHVEHWLNGKNVLTYELGSAEVKAGLEKSKFKKFPDFGEKITGHIMLTYHQDECWYRSIKIRELK
ncbi:MAG: DUF1080 domain-containing protein [Verrucomicrobia bacterium]|nr:DUF1080 domain-containing protein [Verrucomicrobiota bacterium]